MTQRSCQDDLAATLRQMLAVLEQERQALAALDIDALTERVRQAIITQIAAWRNTSPAEVDASAPAPTGRIQETAKLA